MSNSEREDVIHSQLWREESQDNNPFAADKAFCAGYDVYGDVLGQASWSDYIYLLFKQEKPSPEQSQLLNHIAVAMANPGPRDHSVRAAMTGGAGGSLAASCLMAALGPGAGGLNGGHEMFLAMNQWQNFGMTVTNWQQAGQPESNADLEVWPEIDHVPGFEPYGNQTSEVVLNTLQKLAFHPDFTHLQWLQQHRQELETTVDAPLSLLGVISAGFTDLGFDPEQAEMLHLFLRLPGAAVHALEQRKVGHKRYPFFKNGLKLKTPANIVYPEKGNA